MFIKKHQNENYIVIFQMLPFYFIPNYINTVTYTFIHILYNYRRQRDFSILELFELFYFIFL